MAILLTPSPLLAGISGRVGDLVLRQVNGKTVICKRPRKRRGPLSAGQKVQIKRFKEAATFARAVQNDAKRRKPYEKRLKGSGSVYMAALTDYLRGKG